MSKNHKNGDFHVLYDTTFPMTFRQNALVIDEKAYGSEHPEVATDLNNLASLYHRQRKCAQAERLLKRALLICEGVLGQEHPPTGCATRSISAVNRLESILHGSSVSIKQRLLLTLCKEQANELNEPVEPFQKNVHLVAQPVGPLATYGLDTGARTK